MIYEIYGKLHQTAKKVLRRTPSVSYRMVSVNEKNIASDRTLRIGEENKGEYFNELKPDSGIAVSQVYPVENIVPKGSFTSFQDSFCTKRKCREQDLGLSEETAEAAWNKFIEASLIPDGYKNAHMHYAGYILDAEEWCLPSWIWTNAAIVRMYCTTGQIRKAKELSDLIISAQQECGGWIVRNDYDSKGAVPILAPNDSAYAANNGCLEVYFVTGEKKYLDAALRCGEWIIETARRDGMVYVGYDMREQHWQKKHNIVDVGFTAGLFARLYEATGDERYKCFLDKFTKKYIELYYIPSQKGFATSLDENDQQLGGMFGRGQAWALEGLIPAYKALKTQELKKVIDDTVDTLIRLQNKDGGWAYNLSRPLMGVDCKATPIIAFDILKWDRKHIGAAKKALDWCEKHTSSTGTAEGGIFSYTTEGAIVHHLYTWTAFVYSSAYAIELKRLVEKG